MLSAIALAFAIYVRTILYYFPVILLIAAIIYIMLDWKQKKKYALAFGMFFGIIIILLGAWHVRNGLLTGYWGFSIIGDTSLYLFHGSSVIAEKQQISFPEAKKQMMEYFANLRLKEKLTLPENYKRLRQEGIKIITSNPFFFLKAYTKGLLQLMFDAGASGYLHLFHFKDEYIRQAYLKINKSYFNNLLLLARNSPRIFIFYSVLMLILLIYIIFAVCTPFLRNFKWKTGFVILFITVMYIFIFSGGALGNARYRHPIMPALSIIAGYSLHALILRLHKPSKQ